MCADTNRSRVTWLLFSALGRDVDHSKLASLCQRVLLYQWSKEILPPAPPSLLFPMFFLSLRREVSCWYTIRPLLKFNLKVSAALVKPVDWVTTDSSCRRDKEATACSCQRFLFFFVSEFQNKVCVTCYYSALTKWGVSGWKLIQQIEKGVKCFCPIDSNWNDGCIKHSFLAH